LTVIPSFHFLNEIIGVFRNIHITIFKSINYLLNVHILCYAQLG